MCLSKALCLLAGSLLATVPLAAHTVTCPPGDTACVIDALVQAQTQPELTLILAPGVYTLSAPDPESDLEGATGLPLITTTVTIQGQGAAQTRLERAPTAPLFRLLAVTETGVLTLRQLTLEGGAVDINQGERGGGVLNFGTLLCDRAVLRGHSAWISGAIDNWGVLELEACAVTDNVGDFTAGGLGLLGPTTINRSLVSGNISDFTAGLVVDPRAGLVRLQRTFISDNLATLVGGGGLGVQGEAVLEHSVISDNLAALRGGGLLLHGGTVTLRDTEVVGNLAAFFGGGIFVEQGLVDLDNSAVVHNTAGLGGAVGAGGGLLNSGGSVRARASTILGNRAAQSPDCRGEVISLGGTVIGDPSGCQIMEK